MSQTQTQTQEPKRFKNQTSRKVFELLESLTQELQETDHQKPTTTYELGIWNSKRTTLQSVIKKLTEMI
jgi:hypothetical protein